MADERELPSAVEAWIKQLLEPSFVELMRSQPFERVDIKLSASRGRVSRLPVVILGGGQQEFVDIV
jgi:hypothetical protein